MNYFAHGRLALDDPYFLAGTAVPDWLRVVDRKLRVRARQAAAYVENPDPLTSAVARGIVEHHRDDGWFHATPTFGRLSAELAAAVRDALPPDSGMRTWFLGHILVELLLDAELIRRRPETLETYYAALAAVDPARVADAVGRIAGRDAAGLSRLIPGFLRERFLPDYLDDAKLTFRLGQVLRRVSLDPLPPQFRGILPAARRTVAERTDELLDQ